MNPTTPEDAPGSPRGWLPLFSIYEDSVVAGRGTGADDIFKTVFEDKGFISNDAIDKDDAPKTAPEDQGPTADTVIGRFWNNPKNRDVVDAFMNNKLCVDAARGEPEAIAAYKKYAVQDYFYLIDWFKFRVLRLATLLHNDFDLDGLSSELDSVHRSLDSYVKGWCIICLKPESEGGLGLIPEDFKVERCIGELAYSQYLLNNSRSGNWYVLHVILIGCYWGWSKLALQLYNDTRTKKNTIFYKFWIAANIDTSTNPPRMSKSARALSSFLDNNREIWDSQASGLRAQAIFRAVLRLEVGFFNSAYDTTISRPTSQGDIPYKLPLPGGVRGPGSGKERKWKGLLGLESESNNVDEEGNRTRNL